MLAVRAAAASNHLMCKIVVIIIRHFPCYLNLVWSFSGNQLIWFRLISVDLIQLPEGNISVYWLCCIKLKPENSDLRWDGMEWSKSSRSFSVIQTYKFTSSSDVLYTKWLSKFYLHLNADGLSCFTQTPFRLIQLILFKTETTKFNM